ncbi:response regulator [Rhizobium jaguaris]|uniref:Response regulator n=1 Tax=Rhizobium jaguaris TaxID=1312183 RepID=A0A387G1A7_9HYPH|nr:response regulator [Rhizobium jaguaris]AYG62134.1 response regulator [Rhizobium jaguaris]
MVAIVEDDASMRRSVKRLLNAHGFATEEYPSAESFLRRTGDGNVECLVLDVDLGGMSGIELQRRLKGDGSCPPIIFITALEDEALQADAEKEGCFAYLRKPFPAGSLIQSINEALGA